MNRHILSLALIVTLLVSSAAWAQEAFNPQTPPPPPTDATVSPGPGPGVPPPPPPPGATPAYPQPSYSQPYPAPNTQSYPAPNTEPYQAPGTQPYQVPNTPPPPPPPPPYPYPVQPYPPQPPYAPPPGPTRVPRPWLAIPAEPPPRWTISADVLALERTVGNSVLLGVERGAYQDNLYSDDAQFPLEAGLRLQASTWINDRIGIDATYWGLQQWSVGRTMYADPVYNTVLAYTDLLQISALDHGLNNTLGYTYTSTVDSGEINERIRLNMYNPFWNVNWLWGVRYFHFSDDFTLNGSDVDPDNSETRTYKTRNNLVGLQTGLQWLWGAGRSQAGIEGKLGLMDNFYTQEGQDTATGATILPFNGSHSSSDLSGLFEVSVLLRLRLAQAVWLQGGYQYYCLTGLALSSRQLGGWDRNGVVGLDGLSLGLQATW